MGGKGDSLQVSVYCRRQQLCRLESFKLVKNDRTETLLSCRPVVGEEEEEHSTSSGTAGTAADSAADLLPSLLLTQSSVEVEEERSSCSLPSCREEVPSLLEEVEEDSSSCQSFHYYRSSAVPRAAGQSDS